MISWQYIAYVKLFVCITVQPIIAIKSTEITCFRQASNMKLKTYDLQIQGVNCTQDEEFIGRFFGMEHCSNVIKYTIEAQ